MSVKFTISGGNYEICLIRFSKLISSFLLKHRYAYFANFNLEASMVPIFKIEHFHCLPFVFFMCIGRLPSKTLDVISPNITRKGKIFTTNGPISTSEFSERRFLTSRQRQMRKIWDHVIYDQYVFMEGCRGEWIVQSRGRILNVVRKNGGNSTHSSDIQNTLSNVQFGIRAN